MLTTAWFTFPTGETIQTQHVETISEVNGKSRNFKVFMTSGMCHVVDRDEWEIADLKYFEKDDERFGHDTAVNRRNIRWGDYCERLRLAIMGRLTIDHYGEVDES